MRRGYPTALGRTELMNVVTARFLRPNVATDRVGRAFDGATGLLIRSGDGDLFGQTAAQAPARTK